MSKSLHPVRNALVIALVIALSMGCGMGWLATNRLAAQTMTVSGAALYVGTNAELHVPGGLRVADTNVASTTHDGGVVAAGLLNVANHTGNDGDLAVVGGGELMTLAGSTLRVADSVLVGGPSAYTPAATTANPSLVTNDSAYVGGNLHVGLGGTVTHQATTRYLDLNGNLTVGGVTPPQAAQAGTFEATDASLAAFSGSGAHWVRRGNNVPYANLSFGNLLIRSATPGSPAEVHTPGLVGPWEATDLVLDGNLTLDNGLAVVRTNEVFLRTPLANINGYSTSLTPTKVTDNYVVGNIRQVISPSRLTYSYPVGSGFGPDVLPPHDTSNGLQRMAITFNQDVSSQVTQLVARYIDFGTTPSAAKVNAMCGNTSGISFYTKGYWFYKPYTGALVDGKATVVVDSLTTGKYELRIWPRNYGAAPNNPVALVMHGTPNPTANNWRIPNIRSCFGNAGYNLTLHDLHKFSGGGGGGSSSATPFAVEGLELTAQPAINHIAVTWKTDRELGTNGFEIQRSADAETWATLAWQPGSGYKDTPSQYNHADHDVTPGQRYYYRVVEYDFNGDVTTSNVDDATLLPNPLDGTPNGPAFHALAYPNPTDGLLTLQLDLPQAMPLHLSLVDALGRNVCRRTTTLEAGLQELDLTPCMLGLASGSYHLRATGQGHTFSTAIIKVD